MFMSATDKSSSVSENTLMPLFKVIVVASMSLAFGLAAFIGWQSLSSNSSDSSSVSLSEHIKDDGAFIFPEPINVTDVPFLNEEGQTVSKKNNVGKWSFLFFGYTYCPDICPTTLSVMQQMWIKLDPKMQSQTQVVLVSVDVARDTPEQLKTYMDYFDPDFTAFTGKPASLRSFAAQLNAVYAKVERKNANGEIDSELGYLMDHSANITILDPNGNYFGFIRPPFNPKKMLKIVTAVQTQL
ncbi:MAG: protein SCO1/2 [Oleispira sp.]|jgi:protein SCO1/2